MNAILILDTGSSSMRGILFDGYGSSLHKEQRKYFMQVDGDLAEQPAALYADTLHDICAACAAWASEHHVEIAALGFTSQRSSILPLDRNGQPLHNIITWYDKRSAGICAEMQSAYGGLLYSITGTRLTPVLSAPKMIWLKENHPDLYEQADKIVGIHDYLLLQSSGLAVTDASLASRSALMDVRSLCWSDELLQRSGLSRENLCQILLPGSIVGQIAPDFARRTGLPRTAKIITAGGDQQCSVLGQGLFHAGAAGVTVGTGAYLAAVSDKPVFDPLQRLNLNAAITPGHWVLEASTFSSGSVYDWFHRQFYPEEQPQTNMQQINRDAHESPAGARGVIMLPDLAGRGCPEWNTEARGTFVNLSFSTTRGDCARALLEGIAAEIADCHQVLRSLDPRIAEIHATGGLTKSDDFVQILSDMIEFPIKRCIMEETTAIGAYLAAATALGWYASAEDAYQAISARRAASHDRFEPIPAHAALYRRINALRQQLMQSLPHQALHGLLAES